MGWPLGRNGFVRTLKIFIHSHEEVYNFLFMFLLCFMNAQLTFFLHSALKISRRSLTFISLAALGLHTATANTHAQATEAEKPKTSLKAFMVDKDAKPAPASKAQDIERIKKQLQAQGIENIASVQAFAIPGLYEVIAGKKVFYTDGQQYFIFGDVLDIKNKVNLTEKTRQNLNKINWNDLNLTNAMLLKKGQPTAKQTIAVFADPNCGYCKKFEQTLDKMPHVAAYIFPLGILGKDSEEKAQSILCSPVPLKAWQNWMLNAGMPNMKTCSKGLANLQANQKTAKQLDITGTPTIIFKDGTRIAGALSMEELQDIFKRR